jgi:hypothetical protein
MTPLEIRAQTVIKFVRASRGLLDRDTLEALLYFFAEKFGFDETLELDLPETFQIGPLFPDEVARVYYKIDDKPTGLLMPHPFDFSGKTVKAQGFFWPDVMGDLDYMWRAENHDPHHAILRGPDNETFKGLACVVFFIFPSNLIKL